MEKGKVVQSEIDVFQACLCNTPVTKMKSFMLLDYAWYVAWYVFLLLVLSPLRWKSLFTLGHISIYTTVMPNFFVQV